MAGVITFRIDPELQRRMQALEEVNWSSVLRMAVADELARHSRAAALRALEGPASTLSGASSAAVAALRKRRRGR